MRRRDNNTCIHLVFSCQIRDRRCRHNTGENRICTDRTDACHQSTCQHTTGYSRITAYDDRWLVCLLLGKDVCSRLPQFRSQFDRKF